MFITLWNIKEPTHYLQKVGHGVPGVVVCPLWYIMVAREHFNDLQLLQCKLLLSK